MAVIITLIAGLVLGFVLHLSRLTAKETRGMLPKKEDFPPRELLDEYKSISKDIDRIADNDKYYLDVAHAESRLSKFRGRWYSRHYKHAYRYLGMLTDQLLIRKYNVTTSRNTTPSYFITNK